jgi:predicted CXXCH cytochrome family protein
MREPLGIPLGHTADGTVRRHGGARSRILLIVLGATLLLATASGTAFAYDEPAGFTGSGCTSCHFSAWDCFRCHGNNELGSNGYSLAEPGGPHGNYSATTEKCSICHKLHDAPFVDAKLLPAATIVAVCFTCHDGTQGWGVYGTIAARGVAVGGGHSTEATDVVPGGNALTGGDSTRVFYGPGGTLICSDCHSPHGTNLVDPFVGERNRVRSDYFVTAPTSARLLRRRPTGASSETTSYGSDWCLACHAGRSSAGVVHNHPAESQATIVNPYTYDRIAVLASSDATGRTVIGQLGGSLSGPPVHAGTLPPRTGNRGFLMPFPRTTGIGGQEGHYPICQQCHEDSRNAGTLVGDGSQADAATFSIIWADSVTKSGSAWTTATTDNPRFQNFPHETENALMVVETEDHLCLNCHPQLQLP